MLTRGHLDGTENGEIYGWAFDAANPLKPLPVAIYANGKRVADVLPVYYRPDIADRFSSSGSHGFYVDLSNFLPSGTKCIIDARFPEGELLDGSPICSLVPERSRCSQPTLLFAHIPKTAGTALREAARPSYRHSQTGFIYGDPPGFPVSPEVLPREQLARLRFVAGHVPYGMHHLIPNHCRYFTILRHPVSRVWSQYKHWVKDGDSQVRAAGNRIRSLEEMFETRAACYLDNLLVRFVAGVEEKDVPTGSVDESVYRLAVRNLKDFAYVGFQERMNDAFAALAKQFCWTRSQPPKDMNRGVYGGFGNFSPADEKMAAHFNGWDIKLYEHAQQFD